MKYNVGDKVRIKSLDWYNRYTNGIGVNCKHYTFLCDMKKYCGQIMTISDVRGHSYDMIEDDGANAWTDEMIEGLVEDEIKCGTASNPIEPKSNTNCLIQERVNETKPEPKFKVGDKIRLKSTLLNDIFGVIGYELEGYRITNISNGLMYFMSYSIEHYYELVEEEVEKKLSDESWRYKNIFDHSQYPQSFECPQGYILKDENGNEILTNKIILEKKPKFPTKFTECCEILYPNDNFQVISQLQKGHKGDLLFKFQKLLICRDAYWKIAGEEMGLDKPWEPDWHINEQRQCIGCSSGEIIKTYSRVINYILAFPTKEMRDAFYENFKKEIEICKGLL